MRPLFEQLAAATRLTKRGDLKGAVASIQAVLSRGSSAENLQSTSTAPLKPAIVLEPFKKFDATTARLPPILDHKTAADVDAAQPHGALNDVPSGGQFLRGRYENHAGARDYRLFVPSGHHGQILPLVVMLHGCTQDPDAFALGTCMNEIAAVQGFVVLYPAQPQSANPNRCWNWFERAHQQRNAGEPAIVAGMTREVMNRHGIDPQRVYVAGLSAGGAMAVVLGETYPDLYAAIGVHSGLPSGVASDLPTAFAAMKGGQTQAAKAGLRLKGIQRAEPATLHRAVKLPPTIVFHGDSDKTVHATNGDQIVAACLRAHDSRIDASSHRSRSERCRSNNGREYTRKLHHGADGQTISEQWIIHGAGHAWSGGRLEGSYTDPRGPNASKEMIRFFFAHRKPA